MTKKFGETMETKLIQSISKRNFSSLNRNDDEERRGGKAIENNKQPAI